MPMTQEPIDGKYLPYIFGPMFFFGKIPTKYGFIWYNTSTLGSSLALPGYPRLAGRMQKHLARCRKDQLTQVRNLFMPLAPHQKKSTHQWPYVPVLCWYVYL